MPPPPPHPPRPIPIPASASQRAQPAQPVRSSSSSDSPFDHGDLDDDETLQLSSSDSSAAPSPVIPKLLTLNPPSEASDEISKDLAELEQLRRSVQKNLRLRPIRSRGRLPKLDMDELGPKMPGAFPLTSTLSSFELESPAVDSPAQPASLQASGSTTVMGGMTFDGRYADGTRMRAQGDTAAAVNTATTPSAGNSSSNATSTNTTPTRTRPKPPRTKSKGPPPALVLPTSHTTATATAAPHHPSSTLGNKDMQDFGELEIPPPRLDSLSVTLQEPLSATSPTSSIVSSYFTPSGDTPLTSHFLGPGFDSLGLSLGSAALGSQQPGLMSGDSVTGALLVSDPTEMMADTNTTTAAAAASIPEPTTDRPQPISARDLYSRLASSGTDAETRPLLIDTRAPAAHVAYRIRGSVNIAIPSLILKRCRKLTATNVLRGNERNGPVGGGNKGGFQSLEALRQFVVGERMKEDWDSMLKSRNRAGQEGDLIWDGNIIVYDEEMEQDVAGTAWTLMEVLLPLVGAHGGRVDYLEGGIMKGVKDPELKQLIEVGPTMNTVEEEAPVFIGAKKSATGGLFQLDTQKKLPEIDTSSSLPPSSSTSTTLSSNPTSPIPLSIPRSPLSIIPPSLAPPSPSNQPPVSHNSSVEVVPDDVATMTIPVPVIPGAPNVLDMTPSPPPSYLAFRAHKPSLTGAPSTGGLKAKRPSVPNLRRLDTSSAERLGPNVPKLSVKTKPTRSATLTIPPRLTLPGSSGSGLQPPTSPSHLNLVYSSHSPPGSARFNGALGEGGTGGGSSNNGLTPYFTPPHTPGTPKAFSALQGSFNGPLSAHPNSHMGSQSVFFGSGGPSSTSQYQYPPSPSTARPDPPSTESESIPTFSISTILPNFLYLGPELTEPGHVEELRELGVKRILNIAAECNEDDHGLNLKDRFQRYVKIPMRDTVEEENVLKGVKEVCEILDDARLHSAPTYVHCKAGKSRSVTAVMAYLIHANHWTLSKAYAFVLERRKGISPNIGFVSELMNFEEQELGGKSIGVQPSSTGDNGEGGTGPGEDLAFVGMGLGLRRGGHIRESLPPIESFASGTASVGGGEGAGAGAGAGSAFGPMSAGGIQLQRVLVGDQAQEMEVKDASGRYRHARRAPVDENTLQPLRRVSKAGLESSVFEELPRGEREREREKERERELAWVKSI